MADASTKTNTAAKDYTFAASDIKITKQGVQAKGRNAGKPYLMGVFHTAGKDGRISTKSFKAFDETFESGKGISPATLLAAIVGKGGTDAHLTGKFVEGRAKDPNDASKGRWQDFKVAFVESPAERAARLEAKKAQAGETAEAPAEGIPADDEEDVGF